jgi:hypothetical protein
MTIYRIKLDNEHWVQKIISPNLWQRTELKCEAMVFDCHRDAVRMLNRVSGFYHDAEIVEDSQP